MQITLVTPLIRLKNFQEKREIPLFSPPVMPTKLEIPELLPSDKMRRVVMFQKNWGNYKILQNLGTLIFSSSIRKCFNR